MTTQPPAPSTVPAPGQPGRSRRLASLISLVILLAAGAGLAAWYWYPRPALPTPPALPELHDEEVRAALEEARGKVLAAPESAEAWGDLGMVFFGNLFDHEAEICFREASRLDPANPKWPYARGVISSKREPAHAAEQFRQALSGAGKGQEYKSPAAAQLGEFLIESGHVDEAERLLREEVQRSPDNVRARFALAVAARVRGDWDRARGILVDLKNSPYCSKRAAEQLAAISRLSNHKTSARKYESEAAGMPPDRAWPDPLFDELLSLRVGRRGRERLIQQLEDQGRFFDAASAYLSESASHPIAKNYIGAAVNFARIGDIDQAVALLEKAIQLEPDSANGHYTLALVTFTRAERLEQQSPDSDEARRGFEVVVTHARRTTELKPDHAQAYLFWGLALKHLGDPAAAAEPLRKGIACRPDMFDLQLTLGQVLAATGKAEEALIHLKHAQKLRPDDPRPAEAIKSLPHPAK